MGGCQLNLWVAGFEPPDPNRVLQRCNVISGSEFQRQWLRYRFSGIYNAMVTFDKSVRYALVLVTLYTTAKERIREFNNSNRGDSQTQTAIDSFFDHGKPATLNVLRLSILGKSSNIIGHFGEGYTRAVRGGVMLFPTHYCEHFTNSKELVWIALNGVVCVNR